MFVEQTPEIGFPDLPQDEAKKWHARLTHTAIGAFTGAATYEPWHQIPCAYFICDGDGLLIPPFQEAMANAIGATVYRNTGSHNAFLSVPDQIVEGISTVIAGSQVGTS